MPMASEVAALHALGQDDQNEVHHDFVGHVTPYALYWNHMMLMALSMPKLHSLSHDDGNELQHDFFIM